MSFTIKIPIERNYSQVGSKINMSISCSASMIEAFVPRLENETDDQIAARRSQFLDSLLISTKDFKDFKVPTKDSKDIIKLPKKSKSIYAGLNDQFDYKKYREMNKERIKTKRDVPVTCECGDILKSNNYQKHLTTNVHQKKLKIKNDSKIRELKTAQVVPVVPIKTKAVPAIKTVPVKTVIRKIKPNNINNNIE